jgi:hypothetical protein
MKWNKNLKQIVYIFFVSFSCARCKREDKRRKMDTKAIVKLQAMWRGRSARRLLLMVCPTCHDLSIGFYGSCDPKWKNPYVFPQNIEEYECDDCYHGKTEGVRGGDDETPPHADSYDAYGQEEEQEKEAYHYSKKHYCGDWLCPGDCGVLVCGCIDICRRNCNGSDWGTGW